MSIITESTPTPKPKQIRMRKPLNYLLKKFGYEIVKISKFPDLLKQRYETTSDFTFIQIGANDGIRFDNLYTFVTERKCRGVVVEPLPDFFERLALNYKDCPNITPIRAAIHPSQRKCKLYRVDPKRLRELPPWAAGIASLDPEHHKRSRTPNEFIIEEEVDALPLMELIENSGFTKLDLLQTDTEGFDAEIINMIDFDRIVPAIIKYEHSTLSAGDKSSTEELLRGRGYRLIYEKSDAIAVR